MKFWFRIWRHELFSFSVSFSFFSSFLFVFFQTADVTSQTLCLCVFSCALPHEVLSNFNVSWRLMSLMALKVNVNKSEGHFWTIDLGSEPASKILVLRFRIKLHTPLNGSQGGVPIRIAVQVRVCVCVCVFHPAANTVISSEIVANWGGCVQGVLGICKPQKPNIILLQLQTVTTKDNLSNE